MKRVFKITIILMLIFFIMLANFSNVYAALTKGTDGSGGGGTSSKKWSSQSTDFWNPSNTDIGELNYLNRANVIVTVIRSVGIVISVIALMIIGIREMTASVEEKSIIKQAMPGYILGAIMVGAISFLPSIIYNIVKSM